ncbi:MAG: HAMP domain-containing histidine kinase [Chitinophagales bacterium]|nr:HAMP domain-containing histidine kinase [Chitinophagales bacterium]
MNIKTIRWVIILAAVAFAGIIFSQAFWVRKGLLINQSNFEKAIIVSLDQVAEQIEIMNWGIRRTKDPVIRLSPRAYLVDIEEKIDVNYLDAELRNTFNNPFHDVDFTYEVYNKANHQRVFSDTVFMRDGIYIDDELKILPVFSKGTYYFKVNFPQKPVVSSIMISVWVIAILILISVMFFFWYSLNVIFKQRRLSEFQKNFINNLAHELKTPISTISISADVLNEEEIVDDPERLKNYAQIIRNENNRLKSQVTKILQLAKLESEEVMLSLESFSVSDTLQQIADSFSVKVHEKAGAFHTHLHTNGTLLTADKVHFTNVINTLLDNALKYTDHQPVIELLATDNEKSILITVKDNGIGIPKEYHSKIFDKFFRVPTGNIHDVKGFGLGLNYVKMIAKAHKWNIHVNSEINKGSSFTIGIQTKK